MNEYLGEITVFEKSDGPLTKRLALRDGKIDSDSSNCRMARGTARRNKIDSVQALAELINNFDPEAKLMRSVVSRTGCWIRSGSFLGQAQRSGRSVGHRSH